MANEIRKQAKKAAKAIEALANMTDNAEVVNWITEPLDDIAKELRDPEFLDAIAPKSKRKSPKKFLVMAWVAVPYEVVVEADDEDEAAELVASDPYHYADLLTPHRDYRYGSHMADNFLTTHPYEVVAQPYED